MHYGIVLPKMLNSLAQDMMLSLGDAEAANMQNLVTSYQSTVQDKETVIFTPRPGLAVKTRILNSKKFEKDTKLFINVCQSEMVQMHKLSKIEYEDLPRYKSKMSKVPISLSRIRNDIDKAGTDCLVVDACVNPLMLVPDSNSKSKIIVLEIVLAAIELEYKLTLSRDLKFPRLMAKGPLALHSRLLDKKPLVIDMDVCPGIKETN